MKRSSIGGRYRAKEDVLGTFMRDEAYTNSAILGFAYKVGGQAIPRLG
jgi:hypothetical protein